MPYKPRSSLAYPNIRGRRLRHVLGDPERSAYLVECDQRLVELIWREVHGCSAPPFTPPLPEPERDRDVSLAVSAVYLEADLAVLAVGQDRDLFNQLRNSVELQLSRHSLDARLEPGRVGQAGARGFSAHGSVLFCDIVPILGLGEGRC